MGEAFEEHISWVRYHEADSGWSNWWKRGRFNTRMEAEKALEEYCAAHPNASGVALPVGVRPVERECTGA